MAKELETFSEGRWLAATPGEIEARTQKVQREEARG